MSTLPSVLERKWEKLFFELFCNKLAGYVVADESRIMRVEQWMQSLLVSLDKNGKLRTECIFGL